MVIEKEKIILLLPPKTASNSLRKLLMESGFRFRPTLRKVEYPVYHLTLSEICYVYNVPLEKLSNYKIIQIVRNPYDRFISAWFHQMDILKTKISIDDLIEKLNQHIHLLPNEIDGFYEKFYGSISHKEKSFARGNWGGLRFYFNQTQWNDINATIHYFKLEDLTQDITPLSELINFKLEDLPKIKVNSSTREDFNTYYTEEQKKQVQQLFIDDFKDLGYDI
ncbi:sulfotransferase family 2 domain-containing protein [Flavobacterium sp. WC2429]|uniref:Sulfotransferase family 2 domain-containing protein n=2 Tax=unclassified Flavobacterium TaxID=196869 RepID=A0AB39WE89_9FLAO